MQVMQSEEEERKREKEKVAESGREYLYSCRVLVGSRFFDVQLRVDTRE